MTPRPASVCLVGERYVVTGVGVDALPQTAPATPMAIERRSVGRWALEVANQPHSEWPTLRRARVAASAVAFTSEPQPGLAGADHPRWGERMRAYLAGAFAARFGARAYVERCDDLWIASVDGRVWHGLDTSTDWLTFICQLTGRVAQVMRPERL